MAKLINNLLFILKVRVLRKLKCLLEVDSKIYWHNAFRAMVIEVDMNMYLLALNLNLMLPLRKLINNH
jgi:hypothetical protein